MKRVFVEKRKEFQVESESLRKELNENLQLRIEQLRYVCVYDLKGFSDELLKKCEYSVFGEIATDTVTTEMALTQPYLAVEFLPGQFDQRASSAVDCVHLIDPEADVTIRSGRLLIFDESVGQKELDAIRAYYINKVEAREKDMALLDEEQSADVKPLASLEGILDLKPEQYTAWCKEWGLAMNGDDLGCVVDYFTKEGRTPTETELRILDTYWSDHCRHTTFTTALEYIHVDESFIQREMVDSLLLYRKLRKQLGRENKPMCLMDLATIGARYLKKQGMLDDMEVSEENNACSIFVDVDVEGGTEKWLLQFKNETHNHPTEIEPFGGASTCLGGAIRDPLSGRAYVYQAMRVTGAGDIFTPVSETIPGKLPQKIISKKAAAGYSSYGNQIGLATTHVREIYHPGYTAKRLEVGAVVGAVKAEYVRRESPAAGDVILMLGGRTGRDGIGGATGSSKEHTEASLTSCGSEVQKGNAPEERKIQRLMRRPDVTKLIKKSNDFGAGGVSVAIGELADGLDIYLDRVPTKYAGLNPTELAISESQERMAVVIEKKDMEAMMAACERDNIEVTYVADVTDTGRMRQYYKGELVADLSREFIDSAGAKHVAKATIAGVEEKIIMERELAGNTIAEQMLTNMAEMNVMSQKGLVENFDATIGRSTVLMPYGGKTQRTETQVSVQKLPTDTETTTASIMAYGYNPVITEWSPYHGSAYAVIEACAKVAAAGADYRKMRFSYQEYFERMTEDSHTWGKPLAALLGTLEMQVGLGLPSIGGKDSMSGTFEHIHVPPTLIAFGITTMKTGDVISPEFKKAGEHIYLLRHMPLANQMPNIEQLGKQWKWLYEQNLQGNIHSAWAIGEGGVAEALAKCGFGNEIGAKVTMNAKEVFARQYGSILFTSDKELRLLDLTEIGVTTEEKYIEINGEKVALEQLYQANAGRMESVYASHVEATDLNSIAINCAALNNAVINSVSINEAKPHVYIPVFPGTNCDYDSAKAWRKAGAEVTTTIFRNLTAQAVNESIDEMVCEIDKANVLMFAGGFSAGDEPDGSGKYIASVICNEKVKASIERLLARKGLILGICNGFQALVKSGLLPYGKIGQMTTESATLFRNTINRHVSQMVSTVTATTASPWLAGMEIGTRHEIAVSHGEGRFMVNEAEAKQLLANGQVAFRYADPATGLPTMESPYNPNGSVLAIEGIVDPTGQILGKMGHSERYEEGLFQNIPGEKYQPLFENAVKYFKK